jgi:hypothetical protein
MAAAPLAPTSAAFLAELPLSVLLALQMAHTKKHLGRGGVSET